ncbi:hypothetical protein SDC9_67175 [bioreactor metagenome]|uniref:Uncharacterized protein n=1 Tax=bioreactor metagenome TaxID=1076179 RepID=A0A644XXC1_9ZZZZ
MIPTYCINPVSGFDSFEPLRDIPLFQRLEIPVGNIPGNEYQVGLLFIDHCHILVKVLSVNVGAKVYVANQNYP